MANISENQMIFTLAAQMSGNFNATFRSAGGQFSALQKEIQDLNKAQKDIAAYEKQQAAVEGTRKKLETLQQQYDNIQRKIRETEGFSASLENQLLSKQMQIDRTSDSLERGTRKLEQMGDGLRSAGVDTAKLKDESARLEKELTEAQEKEKAAGDGAKDFGKVAVNAFQEISQAIVAAGVVKVLGEIKDAYMECVDIAGAFESSMSNVEALSGATAGELSELSDMAKELGATTKFTATEAADAMGYMAMAGWDAQQMLAGMDGVLQLAAASGEDLALVSDIVTDALTAFGLQASDCAHFSDVLAKTASSSNTSVSLMGETFQNVASIAGALNYSIEDVSVMMGLMANSGIKGANAGTALKNTLNGLVGGITLTGASLGEYDYRATKADGTMKTLDETIRELREAFAQMTMTEQVENAQAIAGSRTYNGLLAILNATDEEYASLSKTIQNCTGAAAKMAAVKMDNVNGELTLAKSAWDALKTSVGEKFLPVMRDVYAAGADIFTGLNNFVNQNPALVRAVAAATAVFAAFAGIITTIGVVMKVATPIAQLFAKSMASLTASIPGLNVIAAVTAAIAGLSAVIAGVSSSASDASQAMQEITVAARSSQDAIKEANKTYAETAAETQATANLADTYIRKLEELQSAGLDTAEKQTQYNNTVRLLLQIMPDLSDRIKETKDEFGNTTFAIDGGTAALRANTAEWKKNAMAQAYQEQLTKIYAQHADVLLETEKNSIGLTRAQIKQQSAAESYKATIEKMNSLWEEATAKAEANAAAGGSCADATAYLTDEYYALEASARDLEQEMEDAAYEEKQYKKALEEDAAAAQSAQEAIDLAEEAVCNLTGATQDAADGQADLAKQTDDVNALISTTSDRVRSLIEDYNAAYTAAYTSVTGQYDLWETAASVAETSAGTINSALESQISYWNDYNSNLESLRGRTADIEGLSEVIASFADGSAESVNAIAGMASASDEDLAAMVENYRALQKAQDETAQSIADMRTGFSQEMDDLQKDLAEDIKAMDLESEAAEAAKSTIQGYIDAANGMLPRVEEAYKRLGTAAANALSGATGEPEIPYGYESAYATGTDNANRGFALVGENGPEIVYFNGGEKVLTAEETRAIRGNAEGGSLPPFYDMTGSSMRNLETAVRNGSGAVATADIQDIVTVSPSLMRALTATSAVGAVSEDNRNPSYSIVYSPNYTISGAGSGEELEAVLRSHDENLRDYILDVVAEASDDAARRGYR